MREYLIYAILIFLPLGFLMAYFLYKQGFTKRQISCFTIAALAAVILFPISAARMGTTATGIIFVFILALFSWQIMKAEPVTKDEEVSEHPESDAVQLLPDANISTEPAVAETAATSEPDKVDAEVAQAAIQDETEPEMIQFIPPAADENECGSEAESDPSVMVDNIENSNSQIDLIPELSEQMVDSDDKCIEQNEIEDYIVEDDKLTPEEEIEDGLVNIDSVTIIADEVTYEEPRSESDSLPVLEVTNEEDSCNTVVEVTNEKADKDNMLEINSLIDAGFENKINGNAQEAVRCFEAAFQLTDSADLKYLLSQELILYYEILGQYTNAINIMNNIVGSGLVPIAGLNQAQQKLEYLQRMVAELERLGMGEVPVSEVPRLVKIKVGHY